MRFLFIFIQISIFTFYSKISPRFVAFWRAPVKLRDRMKETEGILLLRNYVKLAKSVKTQKMNDKPSTCSLERFARDAGDVVFVKNVF